MSILIVDDSPDACLSLKWLLELEGYADIHIATSAAEAIQILREHKHEECSSQVELILMDIDMPNVDGIEACRMLKEMPETRHIPVLMMTGHSKEEYLEVAFAVGALDYICKPISPTELRVRVRSALMLKRDRDKLKAREEELLRVTQQLQESNENLQQLTILDELTGVANRRHFKAVLAQEWRRAMREVKPLSLALIDIDYFKAYNDSYGHLQGDQCLKNVVNALGKIIKRPGDLLARFGGEEFVVLLPISSEEGAVHLAECLRSAVEGLRIEHGSSPVSKWVTISLGVATITPKTGTDGASLVEAADLVLYVAKERGRNQVQSFNQLQCQCDAVQQFDRQDGKSSHPVVSTI